MGLNDILREGDDEQRAAALTVSERAADARSRCEALHAKAAAQIVQAFSNEDLGAITVLPIRMRTRGDHVSTPLIAQTDDEGRELGLLIEASVGWQAGQRVGFIGHGEASPLRVTVRRFGGGMARERVFTFDVGSLAHQGNYSIQRLAAQNLLDTAARQFANPSGR